MHEYKVGDKVVAVDESLATEYGWYPPVGSIGVVEKVNKHGLTILWEEVVDSRRFEYHMSWVEPYSELVNISVDALVALLEE